jgi:hypothetical protein
LVAIASQKRALRGCSDAVGSWLARLEAGCAPAELYDEAVEGEQDWEEWEEEEGEGEWREGGRAAGAGGSGAESDDGWGR